MCILDENGKVVKQLPVKGPWPEVIGVLKGLGHPFAVCYEASCGYGYLHVPSVHVRSWRSFIVFRQRLIAKRKRINRPDPVVVAWYGADPDMDRPLRTREWGWRELRYVARAA